MGFHFWDRNSRNNLSIRLVHLEHFQLSWLARHGENLVRCFHLPSVHSEASDVRNSSADVPEHLQHRQYDKSFKFIDQPTLFVFVFSWLLFAPFMGWATSLDFSSHCPLKYRSHRRAKCCFLKKMKQLVRRMRFRWAVAGKTLSIVKFCIIWVHRAEWNLFFGVGWWENCNWCNVLVN